MRSTVKGQTLAGVTNLALMAPVHDSMVHCDETITYVERLQRLLDALHASRRNQREAELDAPVFPDSVGRFNIIQQFRYAIWPSQPGGSGRNSHLTLNVSFDGGWEPYMRVIQRDIGPLLDALLCHCHGYPGSRQSTFDDYCRWVRASEMDAGLFYTDGAGTGSDARYLADIERLQREASDPLAAQRAVAGAALPSLVVQEQRAIAAVIADPARRLALPMRTLKGLYRLVPFFGRKGLTLEREDLVLKRFARLVLQEFHALASKLLKPPPGAPDPALQALAEKFKPYREAFHDELAWLCSDVEHPDEDPVPVVPGVATEPLPYEPEKLQSAILARDDPVSHGCLVLLGVTKAPAALDTLATWQALCGPPADAAAVRWHVGFTSAGLEALGGSKEWLDKLPPEFTQGMESRCSILGDLRANHPSRWRRPLRHGTPPGNDDRIDLSAVHAVLVLRKIDPTNPDHDLHPELKATVDRLAAADNGWEVLAVEPMRSRRAPDGTQRPGHLGFADGLSQPQFTDKPSTPRATDQVLAGELLLGHANDRGDAAWKMHCDEPPLLCNGTFLVVRKLRQRMDRIEAAGLSEEARAKMMGRWQDGRPLLHPSVPAEAADNAFSYDRDPQGQYCPFPSHARRANPRDGRAQLPRILRRGMSYGPDVGNAPGDAPIDADRGVMFMAYCASIAEQFEVLQTWMAGGNSSGVSSRQSDPFLGVPLPDEKRVFRYVDGHGCLQHVALGDQPLTELQWGLYLFVPSLAGLAALASGSWPADMRSAEAAPGRPPWDSNGGRESWRLKLEDPDHSPPVWAAVRDQPGGCAHANGYGELVGGLEKVLEVLRDNGSRYSVAGYAERMAPAIGKNLLGIDGIDPDRQPQADAVNGVIDGVTERQAFEKAWPLVMNTLKAFGLLDRPPGLPAGDPRVQRPVDVVTLSDQVLAGLCTEWFGLPAEPWMTTGGRRPEAAPAGSTPRCPGDLLSSSRTIFPPHPPQAVKDRAAIEGPNLKRAVEMYLDSGATRTRLTADIEAALINKLGDKQHPDLKHLLSSNIAGMLLGFPPTVQGNYLPVMKYWIEEGTLWQHQQAVAVALKNVALDREGDTASVVFDAIAPILRPRLMATMRRRPVPEVLWRSPVDTKAGPDTASEDRRVIVGIRSAMAEVVEQRPETVDDYDELMFGGSRAKSSPIHGEHACPGYKLGVGVLLALMAGLLSAGTLQPTGSPVLLMLTPRPPRP